jgi:Tfp pilus assembly protein PilO
MSRSKPSILDRLRPWHVDATGITAVLILTAAAHCLVVQPSLDRRQDRARRATELTAEAAKRREIDLSLKAADDNLRSVLKFIKQNRVDLQPTSAVNEHLARLTDLAVRAGLEVDTVEPAKEEAGANYTTVPIRMTGRATARKFADFLSRLRREQPDHGVVDLSLSGQPSPAETPATFTLTLLWYAAPKTVVALPLP